MQQDKLSFGTTLHSKADVFLAQLRTDSARQHAVLEKNRSFAVLLERTVTIEQYGHYLLLMKEIGEVYISAVLSKLTDIIPETCAQESMKNIREDLHNLNISSVSSFEPFTYPIESRINKCFDLGFAYVMEGSKLGGKVICAALRKNLVLSGNHEYKYISDYTANTRERWKTFLASFCRYVDEHDGKDEAIAGAAYAFTSIDHFFTSNT